MPPGVRFLLDFLTAGDVDFVFLPGWEKRKGLSVIRFLRKNWSLWQKGLYSWWMSFRFEEADFNWNHISDFPLLTLKKGHALRSSLDLLWKNRKTLNIYMETHSNMLSCRLAAQGLGVALVPEISMEILKKDLDAEWYHLLEMSGNLGCKYLLPGKPPILALWNVIWSRWQKMYLENANCGKVSETRKKGKNGSWNRFSIRKVIAPLDKGILPNLFSFYNEVNEVKTAKQRKWNDRKWTM